MAKRRHSASVGPLPDEDLELRLGPGPKTGDSSDVLFEGQTVNGMEQELSHDSNASEICTECAARNRKHAAVVAGGEVRFTCGICLDTMKEESSTKCGHIFCRSCITDAIRHQGKCPTCRTRMSARSIRRIFFPQHSSN